MGCTNSRTEMQPEEANFYCRELELLYHRHNAKEIDFVHRKYSYNGRVNENQLAQIAKSLHLPLSQPESSQSSSIRSYYNLYKKENDYDLRTLLALGIILSSSPNEVKAQLLYEAFNFEHNPGILKEDIGKLHDILYKICVKRAEVLLAGKSLGSVTAEMHKEFVNKMKKGREYFREHFLSSMIADGVDVSLSGFLDWFNNPKNAEMLSSSGFRKKLREHCPMPKAARIIEDHSKSKA